MSLLSILGVLSSAIFSGTSLLYATLGEVTNERAGVVNLGLEGVLLVSAASGFAVTVLTQNPALGILTAMLMGGLMNMILAYLVVNRKANLLASGLGLMFFGFGLSALIGKPYVGAKIGGLHRFVLPGFDRLRRLYTSLFSFDILIYLLLAEPPGERAVQYVGHEPKDEERQDDVSGTIPRERQEHRRTHGTKAAQQVRLVRQRLTPSCCYAASCGARAAAAGPVSRMQSPAPGPRAIRARSGWPHSR